MTITHHDNITTGNLVTTGTLTVGEDEDGYDVKFFGATTGDYLEWDESADILNIYGQIFVEQHLTVSSSEVRVVRINNYPNYTGSASCRGLMVLSEALSGSGGRELTGITAIAEMDSTKRITGTMSAITASLINAAANMGTMAVLELTWKNTATSPAAPGAHNHAYIVLRDYSSGGGTVCSSLFWFGDITVGSASASALICENGSATTPSHVIRFMVKTTPYWILCDSTPPA